MASMADIEATQGAAESKLTTEVFSAHASDVLHRVVQELPDACERLRYVEQMTEQAANKVLNLVDQAQSEAEQVRRQGEDLAESLLRMAASADMSLERARVLMKLCAAYATRAADFAAREKSLHTEIMMAQDFQDLSGQVINKVIGMLERAEKPLEELLAAAAPDGPQATQQVNAGQTLEGVQTPDKALKQDDVDDLLASLGF